MMTFDMSVTKYEQAKATLDFDIGSKDAMWACEAPQTKHCLLETMN